MHELAAAFGALAVSPFFFFGGHGNADRVNPEKYHLKNQTSAWQQVRDWTGGSARQGLSITGIDGPTAIDVNASGEWTVNVKSKNGTALQYSVVWGDEGNASARSFASTEATQSSATFSHTYTEEGTYKPTFTVTNDAGRSVSKTVSVTVDAEGTLHLDTLSVTSGMVGSTVTVHGTNFTGSSTVTVGGVRASNVSHDGAEGTLTFTVPALRAGEYNVRVFNGTERSNALTFTVTANTNRLSISGVDAPVKLSAGSEGTWTVHAATNADNLRYSVVWGDENSGTAARLMTATELTQTSSTFTHTYETAGTYKPTFTVTDESGRSTSVSASVVVR